MKQLERAILDLNRRHDKSYAWERHYLGALDKLMAMQTAENEHEQELARIKASLSPKKTMADITSRLLDWLLHDVPYTEDTGDERD